MAILATFEKQPDDVQDYDISFVEWLAGLSDTAVSHTVDVDTGITKGVTSLSAGVVKVFLSGGTSGQRYKVTATVVTTAGRTKQDEIYVKVKEY